MYKAKILVAEEIVSMEAVAKVLSNYNLFECTTLRQAERLIIEDGIDLFVIGIHFDDSSAIELIATIRGDRKHKSTPIIVIRQLPSGNPRMLRVTLNTMRAVHGVSDYIEIEPDNSFAKKLRASVENNLAAVKRIES